MIKAIIFDFFGVLEEDGRPNQWLLDYIRGHLRPEYKLAILSNSTGGWLEGFLEPKDIDLFDEIVLSAQEGVAKPDPEIYLRAAGRLGAKPAECIYVDNHDFRVDGAIKAGMHGILYEDFGQMKSELDVLLRV